MYGRCLLCPLYLLLIAISMECKCHAHFTSRAARDKGWYIEKELSNKAWLIYRDGHWDTVHSYPFSFENATFSWRIRLPSTRIQWKRSMKTELFENALQSGTFWKCCFTCTFGTNEKGLTFRKRWGHTISSNPLRAILETYSRRRMGASLSCLLYLGLFRT